MDTLTLIIGLLLILWLAGVAASYTVNGLIHVLLVLALVLVVVRLIRGQPVAV